MKRIKVLDAFKIYPGIRFRCCETKQRAAQHVLIKDGDAFQVRKAIYVFPGEVLDLERVDEHLKKKCIETNEEYRDPCSEPVKLEEAKPDDEGAGEDDGDKKPPTVEDIQEAMRKLDHADDDHWTQTGMPAVAAVEELLGKDISADDRTDAFNAAMDAGEDLSRRSE